MESGVPSGFSSRPLSTMSSCSLVLGMVVLPLPSRAVVSESVVSPSSLKAEQGSAGELSLGCSQKSPSSHSVDDFAPLSFRADDKNEIPRGSSPKTRPKPNHSVTLVTWCECGPSGACLSQPLSVLRGAGQLLLSYASLCLPLCVLVPFPLAVQYVTASRYGQYGQDDWNAMSPNRRWGYAIWESVMCFSAAAVPYLAFRFFCSGRPGRVR